MAERDDQQPRRVRRRRRSPARDHHPPHRRRHRGFLRAVASDPSPDHFLFRMQSRRLRALGRRAAVHHRRDAAHTRALHRVRVRLAMAARIPRSQARLRLARGHEVGVRTGSGTGGEVRHRRGDVHANVGRREKYHTRRCKYQRHRQRRLRERGGEGALVLLAEFEHVYVCVCPNAIVLIVQFLAFSCPLCAQLLDRISLSQT